MERPIEERFDHNYNNLNNINERLGYLIGHLYEELQQDPTNEKKRSNRRIK